MGGNDSVLDCTSQTLEYGELRTRGISSTRTMKENGTQAALRTRQRTLCDIWGTRQNEPRPRVGVVFMYIL